jgi:hypothetical protein
MAARMFNKKQALEIGVKDIYLKMTVGDAVAATAVLDLTNDIELTSVALGGARNNTTFTIEVEAAAANPTDTVLVDFTGTAAAIIVTVTPNDGTNNSATPVPLTTEELVELINTGAVVGKTITLTDGSSLRILQTATGGGAEDLEDAGEGDGVEATFADGQNDPSIDSGFGVTSVVRNDVGDYTITLDKTYASLKYLRGIIFTSSAVDARVQLKSDSITSSSLRILVNAGATPVDLADDTKILVKMEVKDSGVN